MVALGFLSQGVAYGMTFGLAGTFIGPAGEEFHAGRAAISLGPSLVALLHGLLGPLVGRWLARGSVRSVMMIGAALMAMAFMTMHFATNVWMFAVTFGVLGGAAVSCLGITPVTTLVGRWFPHGSGRALGLANMPILITLLPVVVGSAIVHLGWRTAALGVSLTALALVPVFRLVRDPPTPSYAPARKAVEVLIAPAETMHPATFSPDRLFWMLAVAVGLFDGSGITIITHIVPYATESGIPYQSAAALVSMMGLCGLAGAPLLGMLADRIGGPYALCVVAVLLASGWTLFLFHPPYVVVAGTVGLLGFCGGAFAGLVGASLARLYRGPQLGPAVGLAVLVALPFNFGLPLLAGYLHDRTGTYELAFVLQLTLFLVAFLMLMIVGRAQRQLAR